MDKKLKIEDRTNIIKDEDKFLLEESIDFLTLKREIDKENINMLENEDIEELSEEDKLISEAAEEMLRVKKLLEDAGMWDLETSEEIGNLENKILIEEITDFLILKKTLDKENTKMFGINELIEMSKENEALKEAADEMIRARKLLEDAGMWDPETGEIIKKKNRKKNNINELKGEGNLENLSKNKNQNTSNSSDEDVDLILEIIRYIWNLPKKIENFILDSIQLYFELIWIYPYSLVNIIFLTELLIGWRLFKYDNYWTKSTKSIDTWWHEYKKKLLYRVFVLELFLFSNCFWLFYNINFSFLFIFIFFFIILFGSISGYNVERWSVRFNFFLLFPLKNRFLYYKFFFFVIIIFIFIVFIGFKARSLIFFSLFFFFFRLVDFFLYKWLKNIWPIFLETDEGEFFELFDSYNIEKHSFLNFREEENNLFFNQLMLEQGNKVACLPFFKPIMQESDIPIFDYWGPEGGLIRSRDQKYNESKDSLILTKYRALYCLWIEPYTYFDFLKKKIFLKQQGHKLKLPLNLYDYNVDWDINILIKTYPLDGKWDQRTKEVIFSEIIKDNFWLEQLKFPAENHEEYVNTLLEETSVFSEYEGYWLVENYIFFKHFLYKLVSSPVVKTVFFFYPALNKNIYNIGDLNFINSNKFIAQKKKIKNKDHAITSFFYIENFFEHVFYLNHDNLVLSSNDYSLKNYEYNIKCKLEFKNISENSLPLYSVSSVTSFFYEDHLNRTDSLDFLSIFFAILAYDIGILRFRGLFFYLRSIWFIGKIDKIFLKTNYYFFNQRDFFLFFSRSFCNNKNKLKIKKKK